MKKIKVGIVTNKLDVNGISGVIINYCKYINLDKFNITIMAGIPVSEQYKEFAKNNKINIKILASYEKNRIKYLYQLFKAFKQEKFNIVHIHGNSANCAIELFLAFLTKVKVRIMHIHNTRNNHPILHKIIYPFFNLVCTDRFACGEKAGSWIYGKYDFTIIPNGFDTKKFIFDNESRIRVRKELKINDKIVIGHIGRINYQKNQEYLLDIFNEVAKKNKDTILLLVGTGPDYEKIKDLISIHPYKDRIILYGESNDTASIYSAMDIFVLPSRFEGLPIVLLEAQISGLPCIVSDKVTKELDFGNIKWCSIEDSPQKWAKVILNQKINTNERIKVYDEKINIIKKYQIEDNVKQLENIYLNLVQKNK